MSGKLTTGTKFVYGLGDFPTVAALTARSFFWLLFLTEIVGLPIGLAGTVVAVGRIWDAVNDPIVGMISDRLQSSMGRRRPFFLIGALPLGISFFLTFYDPGLGSNTAYAIYYIVVFFIFDLSFTIVNVPYSALTAELTQDYDERSSLAGWRMSMAMLATLQAHLGSLDKIDRVVKILGLVRCTDEFDQQPAVINGCSELFKAVFGEDEGVGTRSALGTNALPGGIAVEIEAILKLK